MRLAFALVLLVGLALAGGAAYLAQAQIGAYKSALAQQGDALSQVVPTVEVLVAGRPLRYGEHLVEADLRLVRWPADAVPEGTFGSIEAILPEGDGKPRTVVRAMEKDEPVLAAKVTEPGEDAGVAARLGRGMRAFAINIDVASGVSGFLRPGDRVDVYWSGSLEAGADSREITRLIETGVSVVAIDQIADADMSDPTVARTVPVSATPQQVATLAQAQSTGRLSLSLVGSGDDTVAEGVQVDQRDLLDLGERRVVEAQAAPRVCSIRTRRGNEVVEVPIPCATN